MWRFSCFSLLSLALHLACGQLLAQSFGAAPRAVVAAPAPALSVQLLAWAPQPVAEVAEVAEVAAVTPPPVPRAVLQSVVQLPPRPRPRTAAVRPPAVSRPALAKAAAAVATPALTSVVQSAPSAPREVFSTQPQFAQAPPPPVYPSQARRRNQQGVVLVEVRLGARGEQRERRLLRSSGVSSLDQAALTAVAAWRFLAEIRDGQAVPSRVQIPIQFTLASSR